MFRDKSCADKVIQIQQAHRGQFVSPWNRCRCREVKCFNGLHWQVVRSHKSDNRVQISHIPASANIQTIESTCHGSKAQGFAPLPFLVESIDDSSAKHIASTSCVDDVFHRIRWKRSYSWNSANSASFVTQGQNKDSPWMF